MSTTDQGVREQILQPTAVIRPTALLTERDTERDTEGVTGRAIGRAIAWAPRWTGDGPRFVDELVGWLLSVGRRRYDAHLTLLEHALQAVTLAKLHGARESMVVAALLHDIGRPLADVVAGDIDTQLSDERLAASWLARFYPEQVTEPIRLHVEAKRWLVATEPGYLASLSLASRAALIEQGGPMLPSERAAFEAHPFASAALSLRRWDEEARVANARVPDLETLRPALLHQLKPSR